MDLRGAGYWVCRDCGHHNLRQLRFCVSCDAETAADERAASASPLRSSMTGSRASPPRTTPARPGMMSPSPAPSAGGAAALSSSRHVGNASSAEMDAHSPGAGSSAARARMGGGAGSPSRTGTFHASSFIQDLDNKNAVISRLEGHIQNMIDQQRKQKKAHEAEIETIEAQMHQAMEAHRMLMSEYRQTAADLASKDAELKLTRTELVTLQERVSQEARRRVESSEQNLSEVEAKNRELRAAKERIATLEMEAEDLKDELTRLTKREQTAIRSTAPASAISATLQLTEMSSRNEELAGTVERLRNELEQVRAAHLESKERYAEDLKNIVRESSLANERAVASVTAELNRVREASENAAVRDRTYVEHQLRDAQELATRFQGQLEREGARHLEKVRSLEQTIKQLQDQRDALMEEGRFSSEIQQDYVKEQTSLKAEIRRLQTALEQMEARRSAAAPAPLSHANSSHGPAQHPSVTKEAVRSDDVAAMQAKVADAVATTSSAPSPTAALPHTDTTVQKLAAAEEGLRQKDATVSALRGKLETQAAALEARSEELAAAKEEIAALRDALSCLQEESAGASATNKSSPAANGADLEEQLEVLEAKYAFDTAELRKQLAGLQKKIQDRDGDIQELTEENDMLREAMEKQQQQQKGSPSLDSNGDLDALRRQIADLESSLALANEARYQKDELLETKEKEFDAQKQQLLETITRLTDDARAANTAAGKLREELDAANRALDDSEAVCRDALSRIEL